MFQGNFVKSSQQTDPCSASHTEVTVLLRNWRIRILICLLSPCQGGTWVCGVRVCVQQGLRLQERGSCASGPDGLVGPAPLVNSWAPLENLPGRLGPGDAGAAVGDTGRKCTHPHPVFSVTATCWPHRLQGFGCGQTGSCPPIAGSLLRGQDKNQVNPKKQDGATHGQLIV